MTLAEQIRARRKTLGLTQAQLAELVGTSQGKIGDYERGEVEPTITTLKALAKVLGPFTIGENVEPETIEDAVNASRANGGFVVVGAESIDSVLDDLREMGIQHYDVGYGRRVDNGVVTYDVWDDSGEGMRWRIRVCTNE